VKTNDFNYIMKNYKIHIDSELRDGISIILRDYWAMVENDFINKPKDICDKYNVEIGELNKIVRSNSHCAIIVSRCDICKVETEENVYSQTSFREKKRQYNINRDGKRKCSKCENVLNELRKKDISLQYEKDRCRRGEHFNRAIQNKRWNELSNEELQILKDIIRLKSKRLIYQKIFNNDPQDKAIWKQVNNIEKKGLLIVDRDSSFRVISFVFPNSLEYILPERLNIDKVETVNYLNLLLPKKAYTTIKDPDYFGTIVLGKSVKLEAGTEYICEGWINADESITLSIKPIQYIPPKASNGDIKDGPILLKNIITDLLRQEEDNGNS